MPFFTLDTFRAVMRLLRLAATLAFAFLLVGPVAGASAVQPVSVEGVTGKVASTVEQLPATKAVQQVSARTTGAVPAPVREAPAKVVRQVTTTATTAPEQVAGQVAPQPAAQPTHEPAVARTARAQSGNSSVKVPPAKAHKADSRDKHSAPRADRPARDHRAGAAVTAAKDVAVTAEPAGTQSAASSSAVASERDASQPSPGAPAHEGAAPSSSSAAPAAVAGFAAAAILALAFSLAAPFRHTRLRMPTPSWRSAFFLTPVERPG